MANHLRQVHVKWYTGYNQLYTCYHRNYEDIHLFRFNGFKRHFSSISVILRRPVRL